MDQTRPAEHPAERLIARLSRRARIAIGIERAWSAVIAFLIVIGVFVAVSWVGLWLLMPEWARILGLVIFSAGLLWAVRLAFIVRSPTRGEALDRIDRDSGFRHRPAAALADSLAGSGRDSLTRSLWLAHRRAAEAAANSFKVDLPRVQTALHDRFAIRAGVLLALVAAGFIAGPEKHARLLSAFHFSTVSGAAPESRIDAWVDPPAYTGRAPIILKAQAPAGEQVQTIQAPTGSHVVVRASRRDQITVETSGALGAKIDPVTSEERPAASAEAQRSPNEQRFVLSGDSKLTIRQNGSVAGAFQFLAIPDNSPAISMLDPPKTNGRGSMTLSYRIVDDYGIVGAEAELSNPRTRNQAIAGRPLVEAPKLPLGLPTGPGNSGDAETIADLSEHAWAGARVTMTLSARDEAGQIGRSEPSQIILPQRPFVKPLARALVEQRRNLALAPAAKSQVALALDALMIEPERFSTSAGQYLGLRSIAARMAGAKNDDDLRSVLDLMWEMALRIEEGDLSSAERDLKAAQQELREALERGASEDEIRRLMDQLRAAMDRFLQEFADKQSREQDQAGQDRQDPQDPNERTLSNRDLNRMLDQMEEMARSGNSADAQRMLNDLQNMLENLKSARRGGDPQAREMNRSLNQLDQMLRDQQELRDRTFQENQQGRQQNRRENPDANRQQGQSGQSLRENQEGLRRRLEDLQRRMRQFGMKPEQGLEDAESAMRDAEGELGQGEPRQGRAVDAQGRALEGLRKGAQSMAQQMQPGGDQPGQEAGPGGPGGPQGRNSASPDPLGRESRNRGDQSRSVYDPLGAPSAQRAQKVLEELRKRLSDPARPREELDYLERLLRRY